MRNIYRVIYELTYGDSLQNHPDTTDGMRVLIEQNNMLLNDNTALHQQIQQLALQLNQRYFFRSATPRHPHSLMLSPSLFDVLCKLGQSLMGCRRSEEEPNQQQIDFNRQIQETLSNLSESNRILTVELDDLKQENICLKEQIDDLKQENICLQEDIKRSNEQFNVSK